MALSFRFEPLAAAQAAGQLLRHAGGRLEHAWLLQLLYLADRRSLVETGRPLTGAPAVQTERGPTLTTVDSPAWQQCFRREGEDTVLVRDPGDGELSDYDVEMLGEVYAQGARSDLRQLPESWKEEAPAIGQAITGEEILKASGLSTAEIEGYESLNAAVRALDPIAIVRDRLSGVAESNDPPRMRRGADRGLPADSA